MSVVAIHAFDAPWAVADGATATAIAPGPHEDALSANRFTFPGGAPPGEVSFAPAAPLDLTGATELRFWLRAPRTTSAGFPLVFGYADVTDAPGAGRLWRVPVARSGWWEQVRIGVDQEVRGAVDRFLFRPEGAAGVEAEVGELIAVRPEMMVDLEIALSARIAANAALPDLAALPLVANAAAGDAQVIIAETPGVVAGASIEIDDGGGGLQRATLASVVVAGGQATLAFAGGATLPGPLTAGVAMANVLVPVETDARPTTEPLPPAVRLTMLDAREDRRRTQYLTVRDTFRIDAAGAVSAAERPYPQGWLLDYQLTAEAPLRLQRLRLLDQLSTALNFDRPLRVGGVLTPLEVYLRPDLPRQREQAVPETLHLRVCAQQEAGPRSYARLSETVDLAVVPDGAAAEPLRIAG